MSKVIRTIDVTFDEWELIEFAMDTITSMSYGVTNPNLKILEEEIVRVKALKRDSLDEHDWDIVLIVTQTMLDMKIQEADALIRMMADSFQEIKRKILIAFSH